MEILHENITISNKADLFLNALVDEGILNEYIYSDGICYYTFSYDTMGGYLIASAMIDNDDIKGNLLYDETVVEALTDVLPSKKGKELFEVLKDDDLEYYLTDMFVQGLPMRTSLTIGGENFLQNIYDNRQLEVLFEIIARVPYKKDWPLNANVLDILLKAMNIVERDTIWTVNISDNTTIKEQLFTIVSWAWSASEDVVAHLDKDILLLICRLLIWTLATTDLTLRDKTTHALVNLLRNDDDCLAQCIQDYYDVDDDYIVERLFAIAFGCCTGNQKKKYVEKIAQLTYDCVFKRGNPRENIVIRDFSKNIIDYAHSLKCSLDFEKNKITAPYAKYKDIFVPTDEIVKYELNFEESSDKKLYWAQNSIMESMRTEYSSRGMYGDFGRYTFQAALNNWDDDIEQVSNYSIKLIFEEIGYDAAVFKEFDTRHSSRNRHKNKIERIGKKYQWIAMHRVAAILADNHFGEPYKWNWLSPLEINVRKFDPTLFMNPDVRDYLSTLPAYRIPNYDLTKDNDIKWMKSWKKMPYIGEYIEYQFDGIKWVDLFSYYTISSNSNYDRTVMSGKSEREIWTFVQAFIVNRENRKKLCNRIHKEGLDGRSSTENSEISSIYYREYYWSDFYQKEIENSGLTNRNFEIGMMDTNIKVQPTYLKYTISEYSDASLTESKEVIMPSPYLYKGLGMHFSVNDGVWLANDGSVACYDSYWVHGGHGALLIRKDLLLEYLKRNNKVIVWPILMERIYKPNNMYWPRMQAGGYVWMDENGKIHHKFRSYEKGRIDKVKEAVFIYMNRQIRRVKLNLYHHGLLNLKTDKLLEFMSEIDDES